jgi:hypothetical protein
MWIGNLMLLVINLPMIGIWVKLLSIPYKVLFPSIVTAGSKPCQNHRFRTIPAVTMSAARPIAGAKDKAASAAAAEFQAGWISAGVGFA